MNLENLLSELTKAAHVLIAQNKELMKQCEKSRHELYELQEQHETLKQTHALMLQTHKKKILRPESLSHNQD